jgi:hypothetical protein
MTYEDYKIIYILFLGKGKGKNLTFYQWRQVLNDFLRNKWRYREMYGELVKLEPRGNGKSLFGFIKMVDIFMKHCLYIDAVDGIEDWLKVKRLESLQLPRKYR